MNVPTAQIDFESRSACSLRACGTYRYSIDPSTEILCLAFRLPHWEPARTSLWHPHFESIHIAEDYDADDITELFLWIDQGGLIEAHNVWFERCMWDNILVPRHDFPTINPAQWRCSAAKAAAHALPRSLEEAGAALKLPVQKDMAGHKLMLKVSKPRKSRKKERELWAKEPALQPTILWHESRELFEQVWAYCRQDVVVEAAVSAAVPDLNPHETHMFAMDQRVNTRGFQLDMGAVETALKLIASETVQLNEELAVVTGGVVKKATQRAQMLEWLGANNVYLEDTQASTIDDALSYPHPQLTSITRRGLEIMRALGRSSTAKYQAMANWAGSDGRVRGGLLYHGATTGRWSGSGVQPHNFVRGSIKDMDALWSTLNTEDRNDVIAHYGGVMEALSQGLRGAIVAAPGRVLYVADYAAIEARVVLWLAKDNAALEIFKRGEDIYCSMASDIYNTPCNKTDHPHERQVGKWAVLGLGYQMGWSKFQGTLANVGIDIDDDLALQVVTTYRERFYKVTNLWRDQEAAAIAAVQNEEPVQCGYVRWMLSPSDKFLYCELPSGRCLAYPEPEIRLRQTPWGDMKSSLTYMGFDSYSHKWTRQTTYGGSLVENITQAVARDLMADAMLRCEASGVYDLVLSVHDELIAEADEGKGSVAEFERIFTTLPPWAKGCPIEAEGWSGYRYKK